MPGGIADTLRSARARNIANGAIVVLIVLSLFGGAAALYESLAAQRRAAVNVGQALERRATLDGMLGTLVDAETGQRGFLLTGDARFLEPYRDAISRRRNYTSRLRQWGFSTPGDDLDRLINAKFAELETTIAASNAGRRDRAVSPAEMQRGKQQLDAIRDRIAMLKAGERVRAQASLARAERIARRSYILLAGLSIAVLALSAVGLLLAVRTARLETAAERLAAVEAAERETRLIARELNHRVKNLFAVVIAIVQLAGRGATSAADAVTRITGRVQALARAHEVSIGQDKVVDFESLLRATLQPYARANAHLELAGPPVELPVMRVTPIGMIVHELATNAVKYGAWADGRGMVRVSWRYGEPKPGADAGAPIRLCLDWRESGGAPPDVRGTKGFGSRMIDSAVAQLGGKLTREWREDGLQLTLDAPIIEAQAAPDRAVASRV